jgi:general secretion pathway protein K
LSWRRQGNVPVPLRKTQQGIALVIVLWILLLVTISTGSYTLMARMDQLEAHTVISSTRARMAAESGINLAVLGLRDPDELTRLIPDGRPYAFSVYGVAIEVEVTDERGKVDINLAEEVALTQLFEGHGMDGSQAVELAAAVKDWSDEDEIERAGGAELGQYESVGIAVGPGNRNFVMIEELLQVLGMPWDLFKKIEPGLSVYSESGLPDPAYAPLEALLALPDMTEEEALNFIAQRQSQDGTEGVGVALPNGQVAMARGRGLTYSVLAKATLPNGIWDQVEATIQLGGGANGAPYQILRWNEGFHN